VAEFESWILCDEFKVLAGVEVKCCSHCHLNRTPAQMSYKGRIGGRRFSLCCALGAAVMFGDGSLAKVNDRVEWEVS
jgi:hypothetical protein